MNLVEIYTLTSRRDVSSYAHIHMHLVEICAILDVHFEIHIIMHKRVYTVTLDIECWDDLKIHSIDWAKAINLFPDEYIHSSVQDRVAGKTVDRT